MNTSYIRLCCKSVALHKPAQKNYELWRKYSNSFVFEIAWIGFAKIIDDAPQSGAEFEFGDDIYVIDYDDMCY